MNETAADILDADWMDQDVIEQYKGGRMERNEVQFMDKRRAGKRLMPTRAGEDVWCRGHEGAQGGI